MPARSGKCRKDADIPPLNPYHTRHGCLSDLINCYAPAPRCPAAGRTRALLMPHYELSHYYMLQNQEISKNVQHQ
ncbi:hypothetical protein FHB93_27745 [Klebsiella quasipneumoniae]|nr:hypothetical protein FHB93_27745 [Klebsiella quasipneumoniae]